MSNVVALAIGQVDSFAIKSDGTVWGWGLNSNGELGDGTTTMRTVPEQIPALTGFKAISVHTRTALGLKADGSVWAWGMNQYGEAGSAVPLGANQLTPIQVPNVPSGVTALATGTHHSVALTSSGQVWSWGYNVYGQLGNGTFNSTSTPTQASGVSGVTQISTGDWFTLALTSSGTAYGWGDNVYGELGNGSTVTPQSTATQVSGTNGVSTLTAGETGGMVLRSDGHVWDWGDNSYGEAGNGTVTPNNPQTTPYQLSVSQSVPAAPKNLTAVAGSGVAYLTWTAPTSAITQYVVTPYLNGVAQAQVAAPVTAPPLGAPPGTTSSYTVSGLTQGGKYTFTVAAQNCLGTGAATTQSSPVIPTGPQLGDESSKTETSRLTDRMSLHVNAFNGNLAISEHDISIRGTGQDLSLDRTYNSQATGTSIFGHGWTTTANTSLTVLGDGSVLFSGPAGAQLGYAKNSDGTYTAPSGADATLVKNADSSYTVTENTSGDSWNFTSVGVLASHIDRNGNAIAFTHGGPGGAVSAITDTQARVTTVAYNASNLVASLTDPGGRLYQYGYDANQNLTTYTDPTNGITRFAYDASHRMTQITTPAGRVVTVGYDSSQRVQTIGHPNQSGNPTTTFTYNPSSCSAPCTSVTDASGHTTAYTFDSVGRTVQVNDGLGNKTTNTYTSDSNVATYSSGNGAAGGTFGYDSRNNLSSAQVAPGSHSTLGYTDPNHPFSPTTATDPQNNTTTFAYDAKGNPVTETDPLSSQNQVSLTRNANGTVAASTDPDTNKTSYGYDAKGNLTSVTPPSPPGVQSIAYDAVSRPTKITDGKGQATTYAYDALDRVTLITYKDNTTVRSVYDADGNLTSLTDAGGQTTMVYDAMGRLTSRTTPDGRTVSYSYDGVGNLLTLADPGGTTTYTYNAVNLPTAVADPANNVITLGYDANYNRTSVLYPNGVTISNTYDSANRLVNTNAVKSGVSDVNDTHGYAPPGPTHGSARAVTMRGSPSTFGTDGTTSSVVALATPTGVVAGDVEVAQISTDGSATVSSVPSGWTQIRIDTTGASVNNLTQTLYYHVVGSSEPPVNTWGLSHAANANGGLSAWTGVDTTSPVETSSGQVNAAGGSSWTAPSVAFQNGELDLAFYGGRLFGTTSPLTVPPNYTEAYDTQTNWVTVGLDSKTMGAIPANTGDQTVSGPTSWWVAQQVLLRPAYDTSLIQSTTPDGAMSYDALNRLTSTGSTYQYAFDGASNRLSETYLLSQGMVYTYNNANELTKATKPIVLRSATSNTAGTSATSLTLTKPSGTVVGDVLVAQVDVSGGAAITAPAGWTVIDSTTNAVHDALYYHVAGTSEPASYGWTFASGHAASGGMAAYGGVDTSASPIDVSKVATGSGTSMTVSGITTTLPNDKVFATFATNTATTVSTPTKMTKEWSTPSGSGATATTSATFDQDKLGAAGMGTRTATAGATSSWVAHLFALRPMTTYAYDANGNLTGSSDGASLAYDAANRSTSITPAGGSATTFTYRGANQAERATMSPATRVIAACTAIAGCIPKTKSLGSTATFEHSQLGVSAETDGTATTYYVHDPRGGILEERPPANGPFTGPFYYIFDGHGSVVDLTDPSGQVAAAYGYDPYGQVTIFASALWVGTDNPWRYVGAYQDGTGLYHMGARYYDPATGRFTQQDPITNPLDPKQWNRYTYVGGDPVNFTDASGLNSWWDKLQCGANALASDIVDIGGGFDPRVSSAVGFGTVLVIGGRQVLAGAAGRLVFVAGGWVSVAAGVALVGYGVYESVKDC